MFLALYTACVLLCLGLLVYSIVVQVFRKSPQVILCMECRQCMAACPFLSKGCNPMEIMLAAKSGLLDQAMEGGGHFCGMCKKCQAFCPRGLAPFEEAAKWHPSPVRKPVKIPIAPEVIRPEN